MNRERIIHRFKAGNFDWGSWCCYIDLGDNIGVKFYQSAKERDFAYIAQACAAEANAAPAVGETIDMPRFFSDDEIDSYDACFADGMIFGYVTESVTSYGLTPEEWLMLKKRLTLAGFDARDSAPELNTGRLADGTPVQYDFDPRYAGADLWGSELFP